MSEKTRLFGALSLLMLLAACSGGDRAEIDLDASSERARAALQPLKQRLMGKLTEALAEGPEQAIEVCRVEGQAIPASLSAAGVRVGRTSHRLRNPDNAPLPWVEPLLAAYVADPADRSPRTVRIDERTVGYVEPIQTQEMCLQCHGKELEPGVAAKLAEAYPQDRATGFEAGELRGLFWVTLPLDDAR